MSSDSSLPIGALERVRVYVSPAARVPEGMLRSRPCALVMALAQKAVDSDSLISRGGVPTAACQLNKSGSDATETPGKQVRLGREMTPAIVILRVLSTSRLLPPPSKPTLSTGPAVLVTIAVAVALVISSRLVTRCQRE